MQIFVPYKSPLECAETLWNDHRRFYKQIIECKQILDAIDGVGKGWFNHPVTKMYREHKEWLYKYMLCLKYYREFKNNIRAMTASERFSDEAYYIRPPFLTDEFCDQHKRRLFTKAPDLYPQFEEYGTSEENWYFVDGELLKYVNGKRIKE